MAAPNKIPRLRRALALSDQGYRGLKRAIAACTLTNLALMVPFAVTVMAFGVVLMRLTGGRTSTGRRSGDSSPRASQASSSCSSARATTTGART